MYSSVHYKYILGFWSLGILNMREVEKEELDVVWCIKYYKRKI